jgi:hypothetical protein
MQYTILRFAAIPLADVSDLETSAFEPVLGLIFAQPDEIWNPDAVPIRTRGWGRRRRVPGLIGRRL